MKNLLLLSGLFLSLNTMAADRQVIGCMNPMTSVKSYNALFDVTYERLNSYTILIDGQMIEEELITEEREVGPLYMKYDETAGNMYGYKVSVSKDLLNNWEVTSWSSTTYIDDYTVIEGEEQVVCYLLKTAPNTMNFSAENIVRQIQ